ncbi:sulfatase [Aeoliella sp. ICT_H6.2]|uniref:Sulfatase n=1 Tax=Aeoliella straminimaris TaxID=2954799 RepID=A0A9X2FDF3_9BACT|nr:sulfatase [Aeoliella straminimaris]MCO6044284.1 sulfatase [Aeoliella straminimaris]
MAILAGLWGLAWLLAGGSDRSIAAPPPNVLFLAVDDMRDWVGCLGGYEGEVHTPNIDKLASRGMLFTNAHCPSPMCAPSRAAIMTGLYPSSTGLYENSQWWYPNLPGVVTLPAHFRRHGYYAGGAGKIFHHTAGNHPPNQWDDYLPLRFRNDGWFRGAKLNYPWSKYVPEPKQFPFSGVAGLSHENDWGSLPIAAEDYDDAVSTDYAVRFLQDQHEGPFFLACGLFRPHLPWYVPQEYFDQYSLEDIVLPEVPKDDLGDVPEIGQKLAKQRRDDYLRIKRADQWKQAVQAYLASITYADAQLGKILEALDQSPHRESTIVVLWSDHGWHLGEKQHWHKGTLWEEATRVPLVICVPGSQPGVCSRPVSLVDIYPTLVDLTGTDPGSSLDGESLAPLLKNPRQQWERPAVVQFGRGNAAVRSDRYRYIRYRDGTEELYDQQVDPHEWNNLAANAEHQNAKQELSHWIPTKWAKAAPAKKAFDFDPDTFTWREKKTGTVSSGVAE